MLVKCVECGKEVSDKAATCPHCGYANSANSVASNLAEPTPVDVQAQSKKAVFQYIAFGGLFIALFTPKIMLFIPFLVVFSMAIVSLVKKEPRWYLSAASIVLVTMLAVSMSSSDSSSKPSDLDLSQLDVAEWEWKREGGEYSHVVGRATNKGDSVITYFKVTVHYLDEANNVLDTSFTNSVEKLPPNTSKVFEVINKDAPEYTHVHVFVEDISYN